MNKKYRSPGAFTLIELIIVLVIIAIGAVITIPRVTTGIDSAKFRQAVSEVVIFLRNAHLDAVLERKDITVSVDYLENTLIRDDGRLFNIPPDIIIRHTNTDDYAAEKYTFYDNGRGTGPEIEFVDSDERMATIFVDLISGLAEYELR